MPRNYKTVYLIDIRQEPVRNEDAVVEDVQYPATTLLAGLDRFTENTLRTKQEQARTNSGKGAAERVDTNDYIHAKDYNAATDEPTYAHPGIHISTLNQDEIVWYSSMGLSFEVDVTCDPELVRVPKGGPKGEIERTKAGLRAKDGGTVDKPFPTMDAHPLTSQDGKPVSSGPPRASNEIAHQRYYKYRVKILPNGPEMDPHIEFHEDP